MRAWLRYCSDLFGIVESQGLTWLKFIESNDRIMSLWHILEQFSTVFCQSSHIQNLGVPREKLWVYEAGLAGNKITDDTGTQGVTKYKKFQVHN